jgi:hypothetical protein
MNILNHIKKVGAGKGCHDILLLTREPLNIFGKEYPLQKEAHFEISVYIYSYIIFHLNVQIKKEDEFIVEDLHLYSVQYLILLLKNNVSKQELEARIPDKEKFIVDKITAYTKEIISNMQDPNYKPKYLFSSFLMYPTLDVELLYEKCKLIDDTIAEKFNNRVKEIVKYLINICEYFSIHLDLVKSKT